MRSILLATTLGVASLGVFAAIPSAAGASVSDQQATSQNWSGYVAGNAAGGGHFSSVSGSWVEPSVSCDSGSGYDAFWVGLGGTSQQSQSLEQVGTQTACSGSTTGQAQHSAWYELVPSGPVQMNVAVKPGDHVTATVKVSGTNVTVALDDTTSGQSATKTLQMSNPDTSTAEWIAEAPSACDQTGDCQTLPLANFGSINFTNATATANGHTGPISDSNWTAQPVQMASGSGFVSYDGTSQAGASPGGVAADGSSFSVAWQGQSQDSGSGAGGQGYGDGGQGSGAGGGQGYGDWAYGYGGGQGYGDGGQATGLRRRRPGPLGPGRLVRVLRPSHTLPRRAWRPRPSHGRHRDRRDDRSSRAGVVDARAEASCPLHERHVPGLESHHPAPEIEAAIDGPSELQAVAGQQCVPSGTRPGSQLAHRLGDS